MKILTLQDYINYASWLVETGSYKRIDYILELCLSKKGFKEFKLHIQLFQYNELYEKFDDRIKFNIHPFSSNPAEHAVIIDGKEYYTVGNEEQFQSQFTVEIREKRLRDLLDKKDKN